MTPNPFLGVFLHSIGGLAAASFYVPFKRVKGWAWETFWLAGGFFSWIVAPWVVALATAPDVVGILRAAPSSAVFWAWFFGVLWGIGGLTFGLSMRYLGISLGYAVALGFCAAFGTLIPAIPSGDLLRMFGTVGGRIVLLGVLVCLSGIAISGAAGRRKEREIPSDESTPELNVGKGLAVATFAGIMSACMAFAIKAAKPIADLAVERGTPNLWQNTPAFIVILFGGFVTNFVWCVWLSRKNGTAGDYVDAARPLLSNYLLCMVGGTTWYLQFMFYGMGTTQMGRFDFVSWSLHMSAIIVFSTLWGLALREWKGASAGTRRLMGLGLAVLIASMLIVGHGTNLGAQ
ncbi:MAG: L-rhamnose/proton symporter RhaT [Chthonomonadales bacterium]|nr:L-rhamnose/proton symporter RhaT [Chthonomonadales bacterium]